MNCRECHKTILAIMWNIMVTIFVMHNVLENAMVKSAGAAVTMFSTMV